MKIMELGILKGETCNRDNCTGVISENDSDSSCSCHINPPCSYCTTSREYCPDCGWDGNEEQKSANNSYTVSPEQRAAWDKQNREFEEKRNLFYKRYNGKEPIEKLEIRTETHTHFTMIYIGVFPHKSETRESLLQNHGIRGSFGGRFERFTDFSFKYIAYTD